MSPFSLPFSISVIMSVPNSGLNAGSSLWRWVDILTNIPCRVDYAGAGAMNGMKFHLIKAFPQFGPSSIWILLNVNFAD